MNEEDPLATLAEHPKVCPLAYFPPKTSSSNQRNPDTISPSPACAPKAVPSSHLWVWSHTGFPRGPAPQSPLCLQTTPYLCYLPTGGGGASFSLNAGSALPPSQHHSPYSKNPMPEHPSQALLLRTPPCIDILCCFMKPGPMSVSVHAPRAGAQLPSVRLGLPGQSLGRPYQLGDRGCPPPSNWGTLRQG